MLLKAGKPFAVAESKFSNAPALTAGTYNAIADLKTKHNYIVAPGTENNVISIGKNLGLTNIEGFIGLNILKR